MLFIQIYLDAFAVAKKLPNFEKRTKVWLILGIIYNEKSGKTYDKVAQKQFRTQSRYYYTQALDDAERFQDETNKIKAWYNLNQVYISDDNKYLFFKNSIQLANHIERKTQFNALDSLILTKTYQYLLVELDYDIVSNLFQQYLANLKKITPKSGWDFEAMSLLEFARMATTSKKADEQKILAQYNALRKAFQVTHYKDELEFQLAEYYFTIGDYAKSLAISKNFKLKNYTELSSGEGIKVAYKGINYMNIGQCLYMLNRNNEALSYLKEALENIKLTEEEYGLGSEKYTVLEYLSKAYQKQGDYQQAYQLLIEAETIDNKQKDIQTQGLLAENDVQIEQIKQDKRVAQAETQALLKAQEAKIEKNQKYIVLGLLLLTLLVAAWAIYNYNKKKELSQDLENKNALISQQADALADSNKLKDKIFALLSHDLRSPINRLIVALGSSVEDHRAALMQELHNVQGVLNNVLYWSSMQIKGMKPHYAEIPLKSTVDSLLNEFEQLLSEKKLTAVNAIDRGIVINSDENYLKIIVRNLLNNAIKFTGNEGFIHIDYQTNSNNKGMLIVKDTGVGIATEKLPTLFQYPVSTAGTRQEKGTGLGLSLCFEMAKQLKGNLQVFSQEGKGTKVVVELPFAS